MTTSQISLTSASEVLKFWLDELGPEGWYSGTPEIDARVTAAFMDLWERARDGRLKACLSSPDVALAYLIVTDQAPRNMFRGDARAFELDHLARRAAKQAIDYGFDMRIAEPQRQFFYLPFMHSEELFDQDRSVRLIKARMPETGDNNLLHARAHRDVIRRFNRFPYRNNALGRQTTAAETDWLERGGYQLSVEAVSA